LNTNFAKSTTNDQHLLPYENPKIATPSTIEVLGLVIIILFGILRVFRTSSKNRVPKERYDFDEEKYVPIPSGKKGGKKSKKMRTRNRTQKKGY
jgi:hypothetical protein